MKIEALKYFVVTAQSKSITESSQKLFMTQPGLTKVLHNLEEEIGCQLFERSKDGISLTPNGKKIFLQAKQMVEYYNEWLELGKQNALEGIDIYVSRAYSDMVLPRILVDFHQQHPDLPVHFFASRNPEFYISRNSKLPVIVLFSCDDLAMRTCAEMQGNSPEILLQGEFHCLISRRSPLARQESIAVEDLKNFFLVLPGSNVEGWGLSTPKVTQDILSTVPANHVITVDSVANVISQVTENPQTYGISFYPALRRYTQVQSGELCSIPFRDYRQPMSLCLFYSNLACRQHPLMATLITTICEAFQEFFNTLTGKTR